MMRLYRTDKPHDVAKIFPWLIPTETKTRMDIAAEIAYRLDKYPQDTFVLIAIERNVTRAVLIAYKLSRKIVWCWQAQAEPGFKYATYMFTALKRWAKSKGAKKIGIGVPDEKKKMFIRKWGFKQLRNGELRLKLY